METRLDPEIFDCTVLRNKLIGMLLIISSVFPEVKAQLETSVLNPSVRSKESNVIFFTNRPIIFEDDGSVTLKNSSTKQTGTLYFCSYNFNTDSIELNYRVSNLSNKYPSGNIEDNFLYKMNEYQRLECGIKNFYFLVGGYGKSFRQQAHSCMRRLKNNYGDSAFHKASIITFAWGTEEDTYQYYNGLRASKRGAADYAIFQHMLDEFISDSVYFQNHPKDLTIDILFSSMGNQLFKKYIDERKKQGIPLIKAYDRFIFLRSVASRNSFEKGKAFHSLDQITDTVDAYINYHDALLALSSLAHLNGRLENRGPRRPTEIPGYVNLIHIEDILSKEDIPGLGHDYLLTNPVLHDHLLMDINKDVNKKGNSSIPSSI